MPDVAGLREDLKCLKAWGTFYECFSSRVEKLNALKNLDLAINWLDRELCKSLDIVTLSGCLSHKLYNEISEDNAGILEIKCTFHKINYCSISSSYLCVLYFNLQNSFKKTQTGMCNQIKYCTVYSVHWCLILPTISLLYCTYCR